MKQINNIKTVGDKVSQPVKSPLGGLVGERNETKNNKVYERENDIETVISKNKKKLLQIVTSLHPLTPHYGVHTNIF